MTRTEAKKVKDTLPGWNNPKLACIEPGSWTVEATEPLSNRLMRYDERTGFFE